MYRISIFLLIVVSRNVYGDDTIVEEDAKAIPIINDEEYFRSVSNNIKVETIDAVDYIREDNHHKDHVMGVSDEKCDNSLVSFLFSPALGESLIE